MGNVQTAEKMPKGWEERDAVVDEAQELLDELEGRRVIRQKMTVEMLFNTPGEEVEDSQDDILQQVIVTDTNEGGKATINVILI